MQDRYWTAFKDYLCSIGFIQSTDELDTMITPGNIPGEMPMLISIWIMDK